MNYSELKTNIADICENTFTTDQLDMFIKLAEKKVYMAVDLPVLHKKSTGAAESGNRYLSTPSDFLASYNLAVVDGSGVYINLVHKEVSFMREAYTNPSSTGTPKYYSQWDHNTFLLGPTPDSNYTMELHYKHHPESIVTATTTWLGDNFDSVLLNGALIEAARFLQQEELVIKQYETMYAESLMLLKNLGEGWSRQDAFRAGQLRSPVG